MSTSGLTSIAVVGVGAIGGSIAADLSDLARYQLQLCARTSFPALEVTHAGGMVPASVPSMI